LKAVTTLGGGSKLTFLVRTYKASRSLKSLKVLILSVSQLVTVGYAAVSKTTCGMAQETKQNWSTFLKHFWLGPKQMAANKSFNPTAGYEPSRFRISAVAAAG